MSRMFVNVSNAGAGPFLRQFEDLQQVRLRNGTAAAGRAGVDVPGVPNQARPRCECSHQPETKYRGLTRESTPGDRQALAWLAQQVKPAWSNQELCRG